MAESASATTISSACSVDDLKAALEKKLKSSSLSSGRRIVLDIDETLSATNVAWFERCVHLFGNPEGLSVSELIDKYHLAQYVPAWNTNKDALAWMDQQRTAPEAQDGLPLIPGAVEGVQALMKLSDDLEIVGYLTVRPVTVRENTIRWLHENGFPRLPVVSKPVDVPFEEGNQWKAKALHTLWPEVTGIIDDNPKVPKFAGSDYPGQIYLFGRDTVTPEYSWAIPCKTWPVVVETTRNKNKNKNDQGSSQQAD